MIVLEQPYVSNLLINYLEAEKIPVLKNHFAEEVNSKGNHQLNLISEYDFIGLYVQTSKIYTVSEFALDWINTILNENDLNRMITSLKNKVAFRDACSSLYPAFFFREVPSLELFTFDISTIQFPIVLKPTVGFLSTGVFTIYDKEEWYDTLDIIQRNFIELSSRFPTAVVDNSTFILESYITGREFAIDLYFKDKEPVIINIFEHLFSSAKDVSDRLYITNKVIFDTYLTLFSGYIRTLNSSLNLDNIPVHIELRVDETDIMPIEINPLRFAGMCLNDVHFYITGKHPLEYYILNTVPNYKDMWRGKEDETYCFSLFEKQKTTSGQPSDIHSITKLYSSILELRTINDPDSDIEVFVLSKTDNENELKNILQWNI